MNFSEILQSRILVADGATGTELIRLGAPVGVVGELLNLQMPQLVYIVHQSYVRAGCDLVITNTFGGNAIKLGKSGLADRMREINLAAVKIAREASDEGVLVAGDIGPCGDLLKPHGPAEPSEVRAAFAEQARVLAEGGVDLLILETFFDLNEALLALEAALGTGLPVIASMTFEPKRGKVFTMMGNSATDCAKALSEAGATVVGANCSVTIDEYIWIAEALKQGADVPLILQPNAGKPEFIDGKTVYREEPEHFKAYVPRLVAAGARILGGCCGTDPRFIGAIREALNKL